MGGKEAGVFSYTPSWTMHEGSPFQFNSLDLNISHRKLGFENEEEI